MAKTPSVSNEDLFALIEKLKTENEALKTAQEAKPKKAVTVKLGTKGNLCIYGLQYPYPFSFYVNQLEWILDNEKTLREFMKANANMLSRK